MILWIDVNIFPVWNRSYLVYGIEILKDVLSMNERDIPISDIFFPKLGICVFFSSGPGGDINVSIKLCYKN